MLSRDSIATVIKTFFAELDDVRDGGKRREKDSSYTGFYKSYFNQNRTWFLMAPVSDITTFFSDDPIHKLEMFTELLYRDARELADTALQTVIYHKLLELYDIIDQKSMEFSLERMNRVAELKELLK